MNENDFNEFSVSDGIAVCALSAWLKEKTGVDFIKELTNLANDDKSTELEAKNFIKSNYPAGQEFSVKKKNCLLLLDFYIFMNDEHDKQGTGVSYCCCQQKVVPYDGDGAGLTELLGNRNPNERSFAQDFFPQE